MTRQPPSKANPPATGSSVGGWANLGPDNIIRGWAIDKASVHRRLRASVLVDGVEIATLDASDFRGDVTSENKFCGFQTILPSRYFDGEEHKLETIIRPQGAVLHTKTPTIRASPGALPSLIVEQVEPARIRGRVIAPKVLRTDGLVLWPVNSAAGKSLPTTWKEVAAGIYLFELALEGLSLAELLEEGAWVLQLGDHARERPASLWMPARFNWNWAGTRCSLTAAGKIEVPDGCTAVVDIHRPSDDGRLAEPTRIDLVFRGNTVCFEAPESLLDVGFHAILRPGRACDQSLARSTLAGPNRSLLSNPDFGAWNNGRPADWRIPDAVTVDRGKRTTDRHLRDAAADTAILPLSRSSPGDLLIAQRLRQLPASRSWRIGLIARSDAPVLVDSRLIAADGAVLHVAEVEIDSQWRLQRVETLAKDMAVPAMLELRLKHGEAAQWFELDGLDFRVDDEKVFDLPRHVSAFNLVQNPAAHGAGPGRNHLAETHAEIAEGWFVDSFGKGAVNATVAPVSEADPETSSPPRGVAIWSSADVERGRLEIRLKKADLAKEWLLLSFAAKGMDVGSADRSSDAGEWRFIDRIALLRRKPGVEVEASLVAQTAARRIPVCGQRTGFAIHFYIDDFEVGPEDEDIYVAFDFDGPFALTVDSVRLQHAAETPPADALPQPFDFEDIGIALQIGEVRGCEHWLARDRVLVPVASPQPGGAS